MACVKVVHECVGNVGVYIGACLVHGCVGNVAFVVGRLKVGRRGVFDAQWEVGRTGWCIELGFGRMQQ